ncbi:hypothetical protein GGI04_001079 [Coemansia thaxteri]|uniref:TLC domain-containing protein n=1 Tax=Coemansia thaxteri TaxID=2663907 RepID=A0A9W8BDZ5_9FUNG|nr:hypothetical protein H4R26_001845 [Coemansia thaxteri]KAJ2008583.1 hypothetical protein GGI04_001079 [Coemansia thaxteri]KAJ2474436.1 hypothetical protein GGI02_000058 [Coemansia sp. RSA 2322]
MEHVAAVASEGGGGIHGVLSVLDSAVHAVFDPLHLTGVSMYWKIMALSLLAHFLLLKIMPTLSELLVPRVYGRLSDSDKRGWDICVTSLLHTLFDSAFIIAYLNDPTLNGDKMGGYSEQFEILLSIAQGYYIWDLAICLMDYSSYGLMYLIHGSLGVFGLMVLTSRQLQFYAIPYLLPEVSSVFLNIRHLLKYAGQTSSLLYKVNFALFMLAFIGIRVGFEAFHSYHLAVNVYRGNTDTVFYPFAVYFAILGITLTVLNLIWLRQILNAAYYTLLGGSNGSGKDSKTKKAE